MTEAAETVSVLIPHYGDPAPALALVDALKATAVHQIIVFGT